MFTSLSIIQTRYVTSTQSRLTLGYPSTLYKSELQLRPLRSDLDRKHTNEQLL